MFKKQDGKDRADESEGMAHHMKMARHHIAKAVKAGVKKHRAKKKTVRRHHKKK